MLILTPNYKHAVEWTLGTDSCPEMTNKSFIEGKNADGEIERADIWTFINGLPKEEGHSYDGKYSSDTEKTKSIIRKNIGIYKENFLAENNITSDDLARDYWIVWRKLPEIINSSKGECVRFRMTLFKKNIEWSS